MVIRFYLDNYKSRQGLHKVLCELKNSGWRVRIKTGIYARPENWNQSRQQLRPSHPNQVTGNVLITKIRTELERLWLVEIAEGREPFPETVKAKYMVIHGGTGDFWQRLDAHANGKEKAATKDAYHYLIRDLRAFQDASKRPLDFSTMTVETFHAFGKFMRERGLKKNSVALRLATLRAFLRHGHAAGWHNNAHYQHIRSEREKSPQVVLSPEELDSFQSVPLPPELEAARDLFIFQVYTGLRASDIGRAEVRGNTLMVRTKKSETPLTLTLSETALRIWDKYEGNLPVIKNVPYNFAIKEAARYAGITTVVHYRGKQVEKCEAMGSHTARRTCAALLYAKGVTLKKISLILGHATVTTTETYLRHLTPGGDLSGL